MRRLLLLAVVIIVSNAGCASIGVRTGAYDRQLPIYPATAVDVGVVSYGVAKPFIPRDPTGKVDAQDGLIYFLIPGAIVDFPIAIAVDTICLPADLYKLYTRMANRDDDTSTNGKGRSDSKTTSTRWTDVENN